MKGLLGISLLLVTAPAMLNADDTQPAQTKVIECFCTDKLGARVELGDVICLHVDGRSYSARCEMMLNNPMWREIGPNCVTSQNDHPTSAAPDIFPAISQG